MRRNRGVPSTRVRSFGKKCTGECNVRHAGGASWCETCGAEWDYEHIGYRPHELCVAATAQEAQQ